MSKSKGAGRGWLDRWWVQLLVAAWILAIVTIYFRHQLQRLVEILPGR
jgi:hypothetical protein